MNIGRMRASGGRRGGRGGGEGVVKVVVVAEEEGRKERGEYWKNEGHR